MRDAPRGLRKRVQHDGIRLDDESPLEVIAQRITDNVRTLEGALIVPA